MIVREVGGRDGSTTELWLDIAGVEGGGGHSEGRSFSDGGEERSVVFGVMLGAESVAVGAARVDVLPEVARGSRMPSLHSVASLSTGETFTNAHTRTRKHAQRGWQIQC